MFCDADNCPRPTEQTDPMRHYFPMYGGYASYHAECRPGHGDGSICDDEHPEGSPGARFVAANNQRDMDKGVYVESERGQ